MSVADRIIGAFPAANKNTRVQNIKQYYNDNDGAIRALIVRKEKTNAAKLADLFQCLPDASSIIASDLAQNADSVAPVKAIDDDLFVTRVKSIIDNDSRLETYCLPF